MEFVGAQCDRTHPDRRGLLREFNEIDERIATVQIVGAPYGSDAVFLGEQSELGQLSRRQMGIQDDVDVYRSTPSGVCMP